MTIQLQALPETTTYEFREVAAGNVLRPAFGGPLQPLARKGDHWAWDVTIPALDARACGMGLFADLTRGKREPVVMPVPDRIPSRPYGSPVMDGVAAGSVVPVRGLTPAVPIAKGKWMSLVLAGQRYLYLVAADVVADGAGKAQVPITTLLRRPTIDGATVELATPMVEGLVPANQSASLSTLSALGLKFTIEERD
jgi:hypothetical protein